MTEYQPDRMFTLEEYEDVKKRAYLSGLDAARDAVAAAPGAYSGYPLIERVKALAAIDALRGIDG